jgi:hypothetical protein
MESRAAHEIGTAHLQGIGSERTAMYPSPLHIAATSAIGGMTVF